MRGTAFGTVFGEEAVIEDIIAQAVGAGIDEQNQTAAIPPIAAIRAAFGTKFTSVEVRTAIAALSGTRMNFDLSDKHGFDIAGEAGRGKGLACRVVSAPSRFHFSGLIRRSRRIEQLHGAADLRAFLAGLVDGIRNVAVFGEEVVGAEGFEAGIE